LWPCQINQEVTYHTEIPWWPQFWETGIVNGWLKLDQKSFQLHACVTCTQHGEDTWNSSVIPTAVIQCAQLTGTKHAVWTGNKMCTKHLFSCYLAVTNPDYYYFLHASTIQCATSYSQSVEFGLTQNASFGITAYNDLRKTLRLKVLKAISLVTLRSWLVSFYYSLILIYKEQLILSCQLALSR